MDLARRTAIAGKEERVARSAHVGVAHTLTWMQHAERRPGRDH
jgi:hypothetical protein